MAYIIKGKSGQPVMKDGKNILGSDIVDVKLLDLDEKEGTFVARASSKKEDRDKDILHQDGFDLKNFKKNPVIPWGHNYFSPPIAKSTKTWVDGDLMFQPKFDMADEFAVKIFNKYKGGFLTSFSVGFMALEFTARDEKDPWFGGREFTKMELLEISCVTVPANPHANVHVNSVGGVAIKSLVELGYPDSFAKTKNGLFYPIRDVNEFTDPLVLRFKNAHVVYGKTISDKHPEHGDQQMVGFSFAPEVSESDALSFVKGHSDVTRKIWVFNVDISDEKGLVVSEVVKDAPVAEYTAAIDLGAQEKTSVAVSRVVQEKEIEEEQIPPTDPPVPDKAEVPDPKKEINMEVVLDTKGVESFLGQLQEITKKFDAFIAKIDEVLAKKSVDPEKDSCNNDLTNGQLPNKIDDQKAEDGQDDSIELGENLLTPEDKTSDSDPNQIVIDVDDLKEIGQLAQSAGSVVASTLGKTLMNALKQSGRID